MTCMTVRFPGVWRLHKSTLVSSPVLRLRESQLQQHMALSSFCALQRARIGDRLAALEDRLKRNDIQADARIGAQQRYRASLDAFDHRRSGAAYRVH